MDLSNTEISHLVPLLYFFVPCPSNAHSNFSDSLVYSICQVHRVIKALSLVNFVQENIRCVYLDN